MTVSLIDLVGFAAGGLVFLTFCMNTLAKLRFAAIASNIAFIAYGYSAGLFPILILHGLLLPMNLYRAAQQHSSLRCLSRTVHDTPGASALLPFMQQQKVAAGDVLFRRGDLASRLYFVSQGSVQIDETGKRLGPGAFFGEVGIFAADQRRTATVTCIEPGVVCWIERSTLLNLCEKRSDFTLALTRLIATRMAEARHVPAATQAA